MTEVPSRDRMIAAAVTLFARAGFNGVTTKEIAKSANVSEGNIFRYFPTKLDLFLSALESELRKLSVPGEELARITNAEDSRTALRTVLELISRNMVKQPELVRLLHFSALEFKSDIEPMFRRHVQPIFEVLSGMPAEAVLRPWLVRRQANDHFSVFRRKRHAAARSLPFILRTPPAIWDRRKRGSQLRSCFVAQ